MKGLDYWRLCDEFSVVQAAVLIVGEDPSHMNRWHDDYEPEGYGAVLSAMQRSVMSGKISPENDEHVFSSVHSINWCEVYISSSKIKEWLESRGIATGFFFPDKQHNLPYLDKNHPQYAPKLAVAIMAWEEVTNNSYLLKNKSPKKAIESWLENNASKFDLTKQAVEDIAKIANWNTKGGAPSTPVNGDNANEEDVVELEGSIPF